MAKNLIVGCKLPHGLIIEHPMDANNKVTLKGKNGAIIIGAEYGTTEVSADFYEQWIAVNKESMAVKSGAIFVAKSFDDAIAIAKETKDEKTGFEGMSPEANGVKTADNS